MTRAQASRTVTARAGRRATLLAIAGVLAAAVALAGCGGAGTSSSASLAPAYRAYNLADGRPVTLAAQRGSVILLTRWAIWCSECRDELPALQRLQTRDAARGLRVIAVSIDSDQTDAAVTAFTNRLGLRFTIWRDPQDRFRTAFSSTGVPETLLIARSGRILRHWFGALDPDAPNVRRVLADALGPASRN